MQNLIIYFNGIQQDLANFNGTESASFVYRNKTEGGESAYSFAPELTVIGAAYLYVYQEIISAPNPNIAFIDVLIYDTCCLDINGDARLLFTGKIEGSDVRWCTFPNCEAQVTIIDASEDAEAIRCLKNHFPWDLVNKDGTVTTVGYNTFRYAPDIIYCNDPKPSVSQEGLIIISIFILFINIPLLLVFGILNVVTNGNINIVSSLMNFIIGCGKRHVSPFLDSQFRNLCLLCNINYKSSLFEVGGYYHNTVRMDMPYHSGERQTNIISYEDNKPNLNGIQFLDFFKQLNIDWRVINGTLTIERKDYFLGSEWFDTSLLPTDYLLSVCWDGTEKKPAGYAEYLYGKDGVDNSGDEVIPRWTDRVIDWNPANNPMQTGLFSKNLMIGAAQFRYDANAPDVNPIDKAVLYALYTAFYNEPVEYRTAMFITKGVAGFPKLINLEEVVYSNTSTNNTLINRGYGLPDSLMVTGFADNWHVYNYKWHIRENPITDTNGAQYDTAYQKLFYIDDPRNTSVRTRKVTISVTANCELLTGLSVDKYITMPEGTIEIQEITYDTNNNSLTITGLI